MPFLQSNRHDLDFAGEREEKQAMWTKAMWTRLSQAIVLTLVSYWFMLANQPYGPHTQLFSPTQTDLQRLGHFFAGMVDFLLSAAQDDA